MLDKLFALGRLQREHSLGAQPPVLIQEGHVVRVLLVDEAVVPALQLRRMLVREQVVAQGAQRGRQRWGGDADAEDGSAEVAQD